MRTWVVWVDRQNEWHSGEESCFGNDFDNFTDNDGTLHTPDNSSRNFARLLVGMSDGTCSLIGTAIAAYCVHALTRSKALGLARKAEKVRLLKDGNG